jgi:hypothetical protein
MKAVYLTLTNGRQVRIEWNWNAVNLWTSQTGKELSDLAEDKAKTADMFAIVYCAAVEGEEADGKPLGLTEKEFGRLINMQGIIDASKIIQEQSYVMAQKKTLIKGKSPRLFFRNRG